MTVTPIMPMHTQLEALSSHIEILFAPIYLEGDLFILEYLSSLKYPDQIKLVSSDKMLTKEAKKIPVSSLSTEQFLQQLKKRALEKSSPLTKDTKTSPYGQRDTTTTRNF